MRANETREEAPGIDLIAVQVAMNDLWRAAQREFPDLPDVVLTIGTGSDARHPNWLVFGRFSPSRWVGGKPTPEEAGGSVVRHEVMLSGERLADGGRGAGSTLLHEAAHALARARGLQDTSREGRYHNRTFAALARGFGLEVVQHETRGWQTTHWTDECSRRFGVEMEALDKAIQGYRRCEPGVSGFRAGTVKGEDEDPDGDQEPEEKPKRGRLLVKCACDRSLRVARGVYESGPILCGLCGEEFTEQE